MYSKTIMSKQKCASTSAFWPESVYLVYFITMLCKNYGKQSVGKFIIYNYNKTF